MNRSRFRYTLSCLLLFTAVFILVGCVVSHAQTEPTVRTYLPVITVPPGPPPVFGAEVFSLSNDKVVSYAAEADTYWLRRNGLLWSKVQPNSPSDLLWGNVSGLEGDLIRASENGMHVMLIVRSTPGWAQQFPGYACGPIKPENLADFKNFMVEVVKRYSAPPYNVKYYELWNEPDVDHTLVPIDSVYGCWGNKEDTYYGGDVYAHMLETVYPAMRAVNPVIQVMLGGLLLDCDPTQPGVDGYCSSEEDARAPRFFEGILRAGGADFFDIVNFHGYPSYSSNGTNPIFNEMNFQTWKGQGGVVQGKINYLREVMSAYNVRKPIFLSEASLLLRDSQDSSEFQAAKADYLVWLYARNWSEGILGTIWYTLNGPGWKNSGLLDSNQDPLPAYHAYQFMIQELMDAKFISKSDVPNVPGVIEFTFAGADKNIQLYISIDGVTHYIPTPAGLLALYDLLGDPITPNDTFPVQHPVYLETGQ